ncbi:MAG: DUF3800 domain-containing protein, partial [Paracoccaceae bacterium]
MLRYLIKVKQNPLYRESKSLRILNPFSIVAKEKDEEPILQLADLVAHAVYQCTNKSDSNFGIPEYRYFEEISRRFAADANGRILGAGLKAIHSLEMLELDTNVAKVLSAARAAPPSKP